MYDNCFLKYLNNLIKNNLLKLYTQNYIACTVKNS